MSNTNLELFKMSKAQMNNVNGGKSNACARLQEIANGSESAGWGPKQWDAWADLWERNCGK